MKKRPINSAPEKTIVIVAGGIAQLREGVWYTGMEYPLFSRALNWEPLWWANLDSDNCALPDKPKACLTQLPTHTGDGYNYGGDYILTSCSESLNLGPNGKEMGSLIVRALLAY